MTLFQTRLNQYELSAQIDDNECIIAQVRLFKTHLIPQLLSRKKR